MSANADHDVTLTPWHVQGWVHAQCRTHDHGDLQMVSEKRPRTDAERVAAHAAKCEKFQFDKRRAGGSTR